MKQNNTKMLLVIVGVIALFVGMATIAHVAKSELKEAHNELELVKTQLVNMEEDYCIAKMKSEAFSKELDSVSAELNEANKIINDLKIEEYNLVYLGNYKITHYCDERYPHICGGNGMTASGKPTEIGWSAAADWDVIPKGTIIYVQNVGWREVQDVGGGVNGDHVDVLVEKHAEAMALGTKSQGVWMLVEKS